MVTFHPLDDHLQSPTNQQQQDSDRSSTIPRTIIPMMVTRHPHNVHPLSQGCSPTIPRMITHHPQDGHLLPPGWSFTIDNLWSSTIPRMVLNHPRDSYPPSPGPSHTIPRKAITNLPLTLTIIYNPKDSHQSYTIPMMVIHNPKLGPPPSQGWSPAPDAHTPSQCNKNIFKYYAPNIRYLNTNT